MKVNVNFADAESFDAVPVGTYLIEVTDVRLRESQRSEHPYLNWEMQILEAIEQEEDEDVEGRKLWMITSLHPRALFRLKETFENIGVYQEELDFDVDEDSDDGNGLVVLEPELVGIRAIAPVRHEPYNGRTMARVDLLLPEDADEPEEKPKGKSKSGGGKPAQKRRKFK